MHARFRVFLAFAAMVVCHPVGALADQHGGESKRPNILLIVADDVSSKVGAFGDTVADTPTLDRLASEGIRFTNYFSVSGVCAPSRAALISGTYPISVGTLHMRTADKNYEAVPPAQLKAFPEIMRGAGYATGNVAKRDYQFGEPFTIWDVDVGDFMSPPDLAVWRHLPKNKPFFAMINLLSTHESRLAPRGAKNDGSRMGGLLETLGKWVSENVEAVTDPEKVTVPPYLADTTPTRLSIAQMYDLIHYMDGQVAQILSNLQADGFADDTIVIWTTDNGDGFPRAKRAPLDSSIRLPMIIRFPDEHQAGQVNDSLVSVVDIAPTILGMVGIAKPDFMQGVDFLHGGSRDYVYAARDRMSQVPDRVRAVRDMRFQYVRNYMTDEPYFRPLPFRDAFPIMKELWRARAEGNLTAVQSFYFDAPRPSEELYDIRTDPDEIHNLATDPRQEAELERLRGALDRWIADFGDMGTKAEDDMIRDMWPGGEQPATLAPQATVEIADGVQWVSLSSSTEGASIGYRISNGGDTGHWQLYTAPIELAKDQELEAKAIRYGYKESKASTVLGNSGETQ